MQKDHYTDYADEKFELWIDQREIRKKEALQERKRIIDSYLKENFGDIPADKIRECLKEKYPERFI